MKDILFIGEAGAGLVKVTICSSGRAHKMEVDDLIFKETDKQLISDLFVAALNNAYDKADEWLKQETLKLRQQVVETNKQKPLLDNDPLDIDITKFFKLGPDDDNLENI